MYATLRDELQALVSTHWSAREGELDSHTGAGPLSPLAPAALKEQVCELWSRIPQQEPGSSKRAEVVRSTLDLVGREIAVRPVIDSEIAEPSRDSLEAEKARFQTALQDRLDIILTLFEVVYEDINAPSLEPGEVFIPLLEEFVEILLVSTWHELFTYVETRAPRFTKDMPASRGKTLPLLRTINAFLRFLSRTPDDLALRGRVQFFASRVISVADKSATNLRGEYSQITTTWEEPEAPAGADEDGDVQMDEADKSDKSDRPDFYSTLWSLQQFFAHPPSLGGPATGEPAKTPFEVFRTKSDFVLGRLFEQTVRERVLAGKNLERKRKRNDDFDAYPQYLTARSLLEYEIADPSFRRQVLLQYFILFQFLLNLTPTTATKQQFTGGMPKTFVVDGENQTWIKQTVSRVREELCRMQPGGREFEATVVQLMDRERRYAQWKNDGCPETEWELTVADPKDAASAAQKWKRHCGPARKWPLKLGTPSLSRMWASGYKSMDDFFDHPVKSQTVFDLEEELTRLETEEEDERGFGREPPPELKEQKRTVNWLALRAARREYPRLVALQGTDYDLHELVKVIRGRGKKAAEAEEGADAEVEVAEEPDAEGEATPEVEVAADEVVQDAHTASDQANDGEAQAQPEEAGTGGDINEASGMAVDDAPGVEPAGEAVSDAVGAGAGNAEPESASKAEDAEEAPQAEDAEEAPKAEDAEEASKAEDADHGEPANTEAEPELPGAAQQEGGEASTEAAAAPNGHSQPDVEMQSEEDDLTPPPEEDAE